MTINLVIVPYVGIVWSYMSIVSNRQIGNVMLLHTYCAIVAVRGGRAPGPAGFRARSLREVEKFYSHLAEMLHRNIHELNLL